MLELKPSLSASINKAMPSQSSSTLLFGNSIAPGKIIGLLSSQSTSLVKPSPSLSTRGIVVTKSTPLQSSSIPLLAISVAPGFIFGLLSSQSLAALKPSPSLSIGWVSSQITLILPPEKAGFKNAKFLSTTSMEVGVPEKSIIVFSMGSSTASKQTWKITWSSGKVTPVTKVSSQPTRKIPAVLLLKLPVLRSGIPKFCTVAVPSTPPSQIIEYWKERISLNPRTVTSVQICSPQTAIVCPS